MINIKLYLCQENVFLCRIKSSEIWRNVVLDLMLHNYAYYIYRRVEATIVPGRCLSRTCLLSQGLLRFQNMRIEHCSVSRQRYSPDGNTHVRFVDMLFTAVL